MPILRGQDSWGGTKIRDQKTIGNTFWNMFFFKGLCYVVQQQHMSFAIFSSFAARYVVLGNRLWFVHVFYVSYFEFCIIACQGFEITACSTRAPVESSIVYWLTGRWDMSLTCLYRGGMFKTKNLSQTQHVLLYGYFQKIGVFLPNHHFVHMIFHYFHHPFSGTPIFGSTPICAMVKSRNIGDKLIAPFNRNPYNGAL